MEHKGIYHKRLEKLVNSMKKAKIDAILLNKSHNIAYLTGAVNSCSWVIISKEGNQIALVLDSEADVYREESVFDDVRAFRVRDPFPLWKKIIQELGLTHSKIGLELSRFGIDCSRFEELKYYFPPSVQFVNGETVLEEIRTVKSVEEIERIKKAAIIAHLGMETAIKTIKPGIREVDVALEAEYAVRKADGSTPVMIYVGSGQRSCLTHQVASRKVIEKGDVISLDIPVAFNGYCADLSRTVVCGKVDNEVAQAYYHLIKAQEEAIHLCQKGEKLKKIKKAFYESLREAKNLRFLMGPVLHGVGIVVYEKPHFDFPHEDGDPMNLEANMTIAISNIGIYSKQGWGVRIEDTILVTENEPVYLTHYSKELLSV